MATAEVIYGHDGQVVRAPWRGNTQTVLGHLREERRLTGTKEGCAEGDCGACLVLVGERDAQQAVRFRGANACILPLSALHGRLLLTVEDLGGPQALHPVQQALVDEHASQCGFCTPGFVMSLYEHYLRHAAPAPAHEVHAQLSGNLCRCTGYAPILRAASAMHAAPRIERDAAADAQWLERTEAQAALAGAELVHADAAAHLPASSAEVARTLQAHPDARLLGGSTDAGLWLTKRLDRPRRVIHLSNAADLRGVERNAEGGMRLGAAMPLTDAFAALRADYPELEEFADRFASAPVRHQGTLGGNIANGSPVGDVMPVLLALDANLVLRRGDERRVLPLDGFYLGYQRTALASAEFIEAIALGPRAPRLFLRAYKVSKRRDDDISAVSLALAVRGDAAGVVHARLALGGMAATPQRARRTEAALLGRPFAPASHPAAARALASEFQPISDHRATAHHRLRVAQNLLLRAMLEHQGEPRARVIRLAQVSA